MRCSDVERLLPPYADSALPASQSDGIDAHLSRCAACRRELAQLQRSLDALHLAAREPAPDLWAQFQTRLAQSAAVASCRDIQALLPQFAEGDLERAQTLRVRDHLAECSECAALEAAHSRPLRTLEKVGAHPAAVDLWSTFTVRLGKSLSCREVEALLPGLLAGEPSAQTLAFQSHLHGCRACAGSLAAYEESLSALSRVAQAVPEVDLWPAFAARLEQERAPRSARSGGAGWLPALGAWLRGPLLQPAIGFAAFALITVAGQLVSQSVAARLRGAELTRLAQGVTSERVANQPVVTTPEAKTAPAPSLEVMPDDLAVAKPTAVPPSQPDARTVSVALPRVAVVDRGPVNDRGPVDDPGSELPGKAQTQGVRVAFNLPSTSGELAPAPESAFSPDLGTPTARSERDGMQAVVQVVGLLAGNEDALNSPFDSKANDK
jgi:predicted anti-sigma-YlaC factor YlaD